jgi:heme oxygenase
MPVGLLTQSNHYDRGSSLERASIRDLLRHSTREEHERLDARVSGLDLQLLSDYRCFLEATAAALLPLEAALIDADVGRIFPDWELRSRGPSILADLNALGGLQPQVPALERFGLEDVLGTLYVLEGSRLGARVLLRTVTTSPDPRVAGTTSYLRHGAGSPLWQSFLLRLQDIAQWSDVDEVTAAARRAFEQFEKSFSSSDC